MNSTPIPGGRTFFGTRRSEALGLLAVAVGCVGLYFWIAAQRDPHWATPAPPPYYGWQTDAWREGHLYLPIAPHPALRTLPNPYDGDANAPYRVLDLSYYQGRYYSYFGAAPVVVLFLPWRLVSGTYPTLAFAAALFCSVAFLLNAGLLLALRRRFLPAAPGGLVVVAVAAVGAGGLQPSLVATPEVYEVAQACALAGLAACLAGAGAAVAAGRRAGLWLALGSAGAAVAIGSRPNFLPALVVLGAAWLAGVKARRPGGWRPVAAWSAAAGLPVLLGIGAMLLHNVGRFGHPFEFGARFQLSPFDNTRVVYFSAARILPHLGRYLVDGGRITLEGYFPFVRLAGPLVPMGLLKWLPFGWGLLGLAWVAVRPGPGGELARWSRAWLLTFLGLAALLASYFLAWLRYEIDLTAPLTLGAAVGWLALAARPRPAGRWFAMAGGLTGAAAIAVSLLTGFRLMNHPPALAPLARVANLPARLWDQWRGLPWGPLQLELEFPRGRTGRSEPLAATGGEASDLVYVRYVDDQHVALGYFHSGFGGPETPPLRVDYGQPHRVEIFMGSFIPPSASGARAGWTPEDLGRLQRTLVLQLDGRTVMQREVSFYASPPDALRVGVNARVPRLFEPAFTGRLLAETRAALTPDLLAPLPSWPEVVALQLRLWPGRVGRTEPLITTGVPGAGEALSVAYRPDGRISFELDHWGDQLHVGPALAVDFARPHRLLVQLPTLAASPTRRPGGSCVVVLDGQPVLIVRDVDFYPSARDNVAFGFNLLHAGTTDTMFSGGIDDLAPSTPEAVAQALHPPPARAGRLLLLVNFPGPEVVTGQPLVVTGAPGAGDLLFVQRVDSWRVRFGLDHWGAGAQYGPPVEIAPGHTYLLEVAMDSLWPPDAPRAAGERGQVRVALDGRDVLALAVPCHPASPDQVFIGRNPIGGTSCRPRFEGDILYARRVP